MKELYLYGELYSGIVDETLVQNVINTLEDGEELKVLINSPGGSVFTGLAIYNQLLAVKETHNITVKILGIAASMASVISCASDYVEIAETAFMLIHNPSNIAWGDSEEMLKSAEELEKCTTSIVTAYMNKTGLDEETLKAKMKEDKMLDAKESKALNLVDKIIKFPIKEAKTGYQNYYYKFVASMGTHKHNPINAINTNNKGFSNAKSLINNGDYDTDTAWSFTSTDGNKILGEPPDWNEYAKWFLATDDSQAKETKGYYKYPFGKDGKVFRKGLVAIRSRSSAQNETDIYDKAGILIDLIDKKENNSQNKHNDGGKMPLSEAEVLKLQMEHENSIKELNSVKAKLTEFEVSGKADKDAIAALTKEKTDFEAKISTYESEKKTLIHDNNVNEVKAFVQKLRAEGKIREDEKADAELELLTHKESDLKIGDKSAYEHYKAKFEARKAVVDKGSLPYHPTTPEDENDLSEEDKNIDKFNKKRGY